MDYLVKSPACYNLENITSPFGEKLSLKELLQSEKCFKLICGAGKYEPIEIEKAVSIYAEAGARFFDVSATASSVEAAIRGLQKAVKSDHEMADYHICVSLGTQNDPHIRTAIINNKKCYRCGKCANICPEAAITQKGENYSILSEKCIGCGKCEQICKWKCITFITQNQETTQILSELKDYPISCIELHASGLDSLEIQKKWMDLNNNFDGMLSLCIHRKGVSTEDYLNMVNTAVKSRKPYSTIIQTDGIAMSGASDDFKSTIQAVAAAEMVYQENLPVFILPSGGTNTKTIELANLCRVKVHGVAMGTFARNAIRGYLNNTSLSDSDALKSQAVQNAKNLIRTCFNT